MLVGLGSAAVIKRKAEKLAKEVVGKKIMSRAEFNRVVNQLVKEGKRAETQIRNSLDSNTKKAIDDVARMADKQLAMLQKKINALQSRMRGK